MYDFFINILQPIVVGRDLPFRIFVKKVVVGFSLQKKTTQAKLAVNILKA
ncbi:MAG: hypothetical protein P3W84_000810 [Thermodesulfobacteriaceae bacterium]|nr:hypothetical protein [Thermodesulfobacteriaceae bacterium]